MFEIQWLFSFAISFVLGFLSNYLFTSKIYRKKQSHQIANDFEIFKLTAIRIDLILNSIKSVRDDSKERMSNELLNAKNITEFIKISEKYRIPIQRFLYEWNYVPAQDSPKHILNALNDDCIQEILRKLTDISDFLNAAETCHRFLVNAKQCISSNFKALSLPIEDISVDQFPESSLRLASNFLEHFGLLVETFEIVDCLNDNIDYVLNIIADYCGETLTNMDIKGQVNTTGNFNALSKFKNLRTIYLDSISMDNFVLPPNVEVITLNNVKVQGELENWKIFPQLEEVYFRSVYNLRDTTINELITLNPKIEQLSILDCQNVTHQILNTICDRLPNLIYLDFHCVKNTVTTIDQYNEMMMHLLQLRQLRHLSIEINCNYPGNILIKSLATNLPSLDELLIAGLYYDFEETLNTLLEMKQLRMLHFNFFLITVCLLIWSLN